jgi:hypothetical protein
MTDYPQFHDGQVLRRNSHGALSAPLPSFCRRGKQRLVSSDEDLARLMKKLLMTTVMMLLVSTSLAHAKEMWLKDGSLVCPTAQALDIVSNSKEDSRTTCRWFNQDAVDVVSVQNKYCLIEVPDWVSSDPQWWVYCKNFKPYHGGKARE